jgi:hypothetical protein
MQLRCQYNSWKLNAQVDIYEYINCSVVKIAVYVRGLPSLVGLGSEMSILKFSEPGFGASVISSMIFPGSSELSPSGSFRQRGLSSLNDMQTVQLWNCIHFYFISR